MQIATAERSPQGLKPLPRSAVRKVGENDQGRIEKDLFSFELAYTMLIRTLAGVAFIPIEADDAGKVNH